MEERNFYLKNLSDLGYFMQKLKELLTNKQFTFDNQPKGSNDNYIGYCVSKNKLKYWFGLYFSINKNDSFSLWGEIQNYELKSKINLKYSEYYPEPNDKGNKWFVLKKDFLSVLSSPSGYDDKIKLLEDFITEIENIR